MPLLAEAKFPSLSMLRQALQALREHEPILKFVLVDFDSSKLLDNINESTIANTVAAAGTGSSDQDDITSHVAQIKRLQNRYLGRKGLFCRLRDITKTFVCEYHVSSSVFTKFEVLDHEYSFTFEADALLKLLKVGDPQDRVSLIADSEKEGLIVQIEHFTPAPARTIVYTLKLSDAPTEIIGAPPMKDVIHWPSVQLKAASFHEMCSTNLAPVVKCSESVRNAQVRIIASKEKLSLIYESRDMPFQITWKDETGGIGLGGGNGGFSNIDGGGAESLLTEKIPFYSGGMGNFVTDGYYALHYLMTLGKGGNLLGDEVSLVFPTDKTKQTGIIGFLYPLDNLITKARALDKQYNNANNLKKNQMHKNNDFSINYGPPNGGNFDDINSLMNHSQQVYDPENMMMNNDDKTESDPIQAAKVAQKAQNILDFDMNIDGSGNIVDDSNKKLDAIQALEADLAGGEGGDTDNGPIDFDDNNNLLDLDTAFGPKVPAGSDDDGEVKPGSIADSADQRFLDCREICMKVKELVLRRASKGLASGYTDRPGLGVQNTAADEESVYQNSIQEARKRLLNRIGSKSTTTNKLTLRQLQYLRDYSRLGPLDDIVIKECVNYAQRCPDWRKDLEKRLMEKKTFKEGYLAYFVTKQEPGDQAGDDLGIDSDSDDSDEEGNKVKKGNKNDPTKDSDDADDPNGNTEQSKLRNYFVYDRKRYLGEKYMEEVNEQNCVKEWRKVGLSRGMWKDSSNINSVMTSASSTVTTNTKTNNAAAPNKIILSTNNSPAAAAVPDSSVKKLNQKLASTVAEESEDDPDEFRPKAKKQKVTVKDTTNNKSKSAAAQSLQDEIDAAAKEFQAKKPVKLATPDPK